MVRPGGRKLSKDVAWITKNQKFNAKLVVTWKIAPARSRRMFCGLLQKNFVLFFFHRNFTINICPFGHIDVNIYVKYLYIGGVEAPGELNVWIHRSVFKKQLRKVWNFWISRLWFKSRAMIGLLLFFVFFMCNYCFFCSNQVGKCCVALSATGLLFFVFFLCVYYLISIFNIYFYLSRHKSGVSLYAAILLKK